MQKRQPTPSPTGALMTLGGRIFSGMGSAVHELRRPAAGTVPGLDMLRSLAILLVVSGHYYGEFTGVSGVTLRIGHFPFFYFAWTGVDLFFVLSGFLIGRQLWREMTDRRTIDVPRFLIKRGLRIWPYYFAFVAWTMVFSSKPFSAFLPDIFFVSNYLPDGVSGSWSLSTEEQFYIFVPLLLLAVGTSIPVRRQYLVIIALLCLLPVVRYQTLRVQHTDLTQEVIVRTIQLPFHTHADGLLAGLLLSWFAVLKPEFLRPQPLLRNLILPTILATAGLMLRRLNPHLFAFSALALIFGGATLFVLRHENPLRNPPQNHLFHLVSRLSYGMYLNHFPIVSVGVPLLLATGMSNRPYVNFIVGYPVILAASMLVAAGTFVLIESPFLKLRDRWLAGR